MTQQEALKILKTGANVFLTGAAGSGKTYVLREYIKYLKDYGVNVGITASTGIAATHMNGMTIHSWSGIGINNDLSKEEMEGREYLSRRIKNANVLIIDEISMLHHFRLDLVEKVVKFFKNNDEPFGGLQVVVCGDFFQLPPIQRSGEAEAKFVYHSKAWENLNFKICYLHEQHRQSDLKYLSVLNAIRGSVVSDEIRDVLNSRIDVDLETTLKPVKLYSHNANVDIENEKELSKLPGKVFSYEMNSKGKSTIAEALKKSCLAPEILQLKEGAKVMFVKNNFEKGYANGTTGIIEECDNYNVKVRVSGGRIVNVEPESWRIEEDGKTKAEVMQYPLRLAWAITIHKSQGMSLSAAEIDLSRAFEKGMGYVALSRVCSLAGLTMKGFNETALLTNDEVADFDREFNKTSKKHTDEINKFSPAELEKLHNNFLNKIGVSSGEKKSKKTNTVSETKNLIGEGLSIKEVAKKRELKETTITDHVEKIIAKNPDFDISHLRKDISDSRYDEIVEAFQETKPDKKGIYPLSPVKEILGDDFSYDEIRLVRLFL